MCYSPAKFSSNPINHSFLLHGKHHQLGANSHRDLVLGLHKTMIGICACAELLGYEQSP